MELANLVSVNPTNGGNSKCPARFKIKLVQDDAKSREAGRIIHREQIVLEKMPLDGLNQEYKVNGDDPTDRWKSEYPTEWERFQESSAKKREQVAGTLLEEWGRIPARLVADLAYLNIYTVEQFCTVEDTKLLDWGIPNAKALKSEAQAYLKGSKDKGIPQKLQHDLDIALAKVAELQEICTAQKLEIERLRKAE